MLSQLHITGDTPMGATLVEGGATFRVWAPSARGVYLNGVFGGVADWSRDDSPSLLLKDAAGYWAGFLPGVAANDVYTYYVVGPPGGTIGFKRDPYARELATLASAPVDTVCVVRSPSAYPWHDAGFTTPDFADMVVYQLHVGSYASAPPSYGTFLDVVEKLPYLVALGVNVLQPLPVTESEANPSLGYNGADYFSPDTVYTVTDGDALAAHLVTINRLLAAKGCDALTLDQVTGATQLRVLVDLCHLYGVAVVFDVVYNHAGGFTGDDESIYFWDREANPDDNNNSLYFIDQGIAGGLSFALWKREVQQFLIDNASFWLREFHVDGFRYDEVSELLANDRTSGWGFCQAVTGTVRFLRDRALQNAEYWPSEYSASVASILTPSAEGGAGFDVVQHDALRLAVRSAIAASSGGADASVSMSAVGAALQPSGLPDAWRAVTCVENHDVVYSGRDVRVPVLADGSDHESFYARSRSKVATGLLLTAPGIPQLFMGQEFLEDRQWDTNPAGPNCVDWAGLAAGNKAMVDELRFTQDLVRLRRGEPALRGQSVHVFHVHDVNRVIAFHRWVEGQGRDIVVVASLNDSPFFGYALGFPRAGAWTELFNSDVYDNWVNPLAVGNAGRIDASGGPLHDLPASARITIPPRSVLVFGV